jgi:hypothetical protein
LQQQALTQGGSGDVSESQRRRVAEHLRAIGRLPANHEQLSAQVLRSIAAMYALLPSATDDVQRKSVIRQAFANDAALRAALLGLIELMDSSVDTTDPVIQSAKIDALIKILLFEEQRRKEGGRFPSGASGRSPSGVHPVPSFLGGFAAGPTAAGSSHPPPLPGGSQLPPPSAARAVHLAPDPDAALLGVPPSHALPASYAPVVGGPPLPNLPAEPVPARRRSLPPPLPPSYHGGSS